ncbi:MAG: gliding motility-associated C-terminal domain-containing protein [Bacteroidetes bacterium]|nr:gliding motility-associated C-terminal domain-containing protein [Bacteroidota bacterium]
MIKFLLSFFLLFLGLNAYSQIDYIGSGRCITLDGINDYVQVGNYKNINFPLTISAWIYLDPSAIGANPILVSNDDNVTYHGFWFVISPTALECEFGDGTGGNNAAYRQGKIASVSNVLGRWIHVCAVMPSISPSDMALYINGVNIGGNASGGSGLPMASSNTNDKGKIGYLLSNNGNVTYHFKGSIDEVRLYNRALSQTEVQQTMCKKLVGNETGLVGYWNFNETSGTTAIDNSSAKQNGTFVGNVQRGFSGAAIGDDSKNQYTSNWAGNTLSFQDGNDKINVSNIQGNPEGIQIYEVKNLPSQTGGLDTSQVSRPYFGIYTASLDVDNTFNATYTYQGTNSCNMFTRSDNSIAAWTSSANPVTNVLQRTELIKTNGVSPKVDLGANQTLCATTTASTAISTGLDNNQFSFHWNTGQTTSSITVNQSGEYWVEVTNACGSAKDSVKILFDEAPPPTFSLGESNVSCKFDTVLLRPFLNLSNYQFVWQDNSTNSFFKATTFGKYWVTVKNSCGESSDTIAFLEMKKPLGLVPNVITPNDGNNLNQFFKIDNSLTGDVTFRVINRWGREVYKSSAYNNDWDGGDLDSGIYYFVISGDCVEEYKSWLSIIR